MKVAVIGLGVEGKKATKSLLTNGHNVYATDSNNNIDLEKLKTTIFPKSDSNHTNIPTDQLIINTSNKNSDMITSCDAIVLSPSLWKLQLTKDIIKSKKLISDVLTKHKNIFTIGITGTNGKTTTVLMLKKILENSGKKVLVGGNAGGGFNGYCDIILEAEKEKYDIILIEICDMTLPFCDYCFNIDLIGLTNIGNDHMNVHGSINNYKNSIIKFSKNKTIFLDKKSSTINNHDSFISNLSDNKNNTEIHEYNQYPQELKVFGKFNKNNAGLASAIAKHLKIPNQHIFETLKKFEPVKGRLKIYKLNNSKIFIGKTDNSHAVQSILNEQQFHTTIIGTPRSNEKHRLDILDHIVASNPETIILFPGLDNNITHALNKLHSTGFKGKIKIAKNLNKIITYLTKHSQEKTIFIGGNNQETIIKIQERLNILCNDKLT